MASAFVPWYKRWFLRLPYLFKTCPSGNRHPFWDQLCWCRMGEHSHCITGSHSWHGGAYVFASRKDHRIPRELIPQYEVERRVGQARKYGAERGPLKFEKITTPVVAGPVPEGKTIRELFGEES